MCWCQYFSGAWLLAVLVASFSMLKMLPEAPSAVTLTTNLYIWVISLHEDWIDGQAWSSLLGVPLGRDWNLVACPAGRYEFCVVVADVCQLIVLLACQRKLNVHSEFVWFRTTSSFLYTVLNMTGSCNWQRSRWNFNYNLHKNKGWIFSCMFLLLLLLYASLPAAGAPIIQQQQQQQVVES